MTDYCEGLTPEQESRLEALYKEIEALSVWLVEREKNGEFYPAAYLKLEHLYREVNSAREGTTGTISQIKEEARSLYVRHHRAQG